MENENEKNFYARRVGAPHSLLRLQKIRYEKKNEEKKKEKNVTK